jgi:ABC-type lipoprotein release transport system permease subunit
VVVAPLPVFRLSAYLRPGIYATGFAIAVIALYALVIAAGFFPARLATKIQPFQALRYD